MRIDPAEFIKSSLRLAPVPGLADVVLYQAHAGSRLSRLERDEPPYWAYAWGGGMVLAHYLMEHREAVSGRRVLDLGAGSGLVGIVAARLGASVAAAEIDPWGRAAIALNAAANSVKIDIVAVNVDGPAPEGFGVILAGDVFYLPEIAAGMLPFLRRCTAAGADVLIGDPDRRDLPLHALTPLARRTITDMGGTEREAGVYALRA